MYYHGTLISATGQTVEVHIVTRRDRTACVEIGDAAAGIWFAGADAVETQASVNDTFDHLVRSSATIRLLTRSFTADFFTADYRDAVVNICRDGECVFAGFIEPQAYQQSYNSALDELELSCVDALSALQYTRYADVGAFGVSHELLKAGAGRRTMAELLCGSLEAVYTGLDITGGTTAPVCLFDGSRRLTAGGDPTAIFTALSVSELLFLGRDEDDTWTREDVVTEIMRYLGLHIVQSGLRFHIYDRASLKSDDPIVWRDLGTGAVAAVPRADVEITEAIAADTDTTVSIGEVYNQIAVTCDMEPVESVIESPLSVEALTSPYSNRQLYMTEISASGEGVTAYNAFWDMIHRRRPDEYDGGLFTRWYLQVKENQRWHFPDHGMQADTSLVDRFCRDGRNQQALPQYMVSHPAAAILSVGKVEDELSYDDNSPVPKVDMTDCLCISVNGNGVDTVGQSYPAEADIKGAIPLAVYRGGASGGVYSPSDEDTVNYIVISGKIILNPRMEMTAPYREIAGASSSAYHDGKLYWHKTVPGRDEPRYYTRRYWNAATPRDTPADSGVTDGFVPFTDRGPQLYEFKYSAIGDSSDRISKIAVLACMLVIGDKCLVETGTQGQVSDFEWRAYKTRQECAGDDEYYSQCFTIGFDPKIGDRLVGTRFDIQNNISFEMGIDAAGTAIPIRKDDALSGPVEFMILGPVNTTWGEITRRHPTWFRSERWGQTQVPLLAHVSGIIVESFEVKVYSDNGRVNNLEDNDLVYLSDTREDFVNRKDDITFRICSALTAGERRELGVSDSVSLSTPLDSTTGTGVLAVHDAAGGVTAKPERLYVDSYWREFHAPRVLMTQRVTDTPAAVGLFNRYTHPAMATRFFVQGISRNLHEGTAELNLKEIEND